MLTKYVWSISNMPLEIDWIAPIVVHFASEAPNDMVGETSDYCRQGVNKTKAQFFPETEVTKRQWILSLLIACPNGVHRPFASRWCFLLHLDSLFCVVFHRSFILAKQCLHSLRDTVLGPIIEYCRFFTLPFSQSLLPCLQFFVLYLLCWYSYLFSKSL